MAKKPPRRRNPIARALRSEGLRRRVIENKLRYNRKKERKEQPCCGLRPSLVLLHGREPHTQGGHEV